MADINLDKLMLSGASTGMASPLAGADSQRILQEKRDNVANADYADKQEAFFIEAVKDNLFGEFLEFDRDIKLSSIPAQEGFKIDDESTLFAMEKHGLPFSDFKYLRKSKSQKELDLRLQHLSQVKRSNDKVNNALSNSERMNAKIAGAVVSPEVIAGFGAGMLYKSSATLLRVAMIEGSVEAGLTATRYMISDNYTMEDAVKDTLIGTGLAVGATGLFRRWDNTVSRKEYLDNNTASFFEQDLSKQYVWSASRPDEMTKRTNEISEVDSIYLTEFEKRSVELKDNIYKNMNVSDEERLRLVEEEFGTKASGYIFDRDINKRLKEIGDELNELERPFDPTSPDPNRQHLNVDRIAELRTEGSALRDRLDTGESARRQEFEVRLNQEKQKLYIDAEEQWFRKQKNQELIEKFKDKKYDQYNINRRTFFNIQDNIKSVQLKKQIDAVNETIASIKTKLKEAHNNLALAKSKSWKTRHKNTINRLQGELDKAKKGLASKLKDKPLTKDEEDFKLMINNMSEDIINVKNELTDLIKIASKEDIANMMDVLDELKRLHPEEMSDLHSIAKSKFNQKTVDQLDKLGGLKGKTLPKAVMVTLGLAVAANASESDDIADELTAMFMLVVGGVALAVSPSVIRKIRNPQIRENLSTMGDKFKESYKKSSAELSPEAGVIRRTAKFFGTAGHTRLTSTYAPFQKAGGKALDIMDRLVFGKNNGSGAEVVKQMWNHSGMQRYNLAEKKAYKLWKVENGIDGIKGVFSELNNVHLFREGLADQMILRNTSSKAIKNFINEADEIFDEIYTRAKDYDVYGFDKINYKKGMLPRYWNNMKMHDILTNAVNPQRVKDELVGSLATAFVKGRGRQRAGIIKAIEDLKTQGDLEGASKMEKKYKALLDPSGDSKHSQEMAEKFVDRWVKGSEDHIDQSRESIFELLEGHLKDDVTFDDVANALNTSNDRSSRAKWRIDFDPMDIVDIRVETLNGDTVTIGRKTMIDTDLKSIMDKTMNHMNGLSALAKNGYKSVTALDRVIDDFSKSGVKDANRLAHEMRQVRDLVLGIPIAHNSPLFHNIAMAMKDMTIAVKLPYVVLSLGSELLNTLGASKLNKTLKSLSDSLLVAFGKDSYMMANLSRISGLASNVDRVDFHGFRGVSENADNIDDLHNTSKLRNATMKIRDISLYLNRLLSATDLFQRAGVAINTEKLARFINLGDESIEGINKSRLTMYGITDDKIKLLEGKFEFNEKGKLKDIDFSKWTPKEEDTLGEILRAMNQSISPESTIGETALFTHTTDGGRIFSTLSMYPMQQYNIQGLGGLEAFDRTSLTHIFGAFAGSYIGLQARYALQDKEVDDEKVLLYSIMNIPQLGGLSYMMSMLSPATLQVVNDAAALIGAEKR